MSNVRAEVLRVSRSRTGWRDGSNQKTPQRPYISTLKSTFEGSTTHEKQRTEAQPKSGSGGGDGGGGGGCDLPTKPPRLSGTKVSTIANMFQAMTPTKEEIYHARPGFAKPESVRSDHDRKSLETVVTEGHKNERRDQHSPQENSREPNSGSVHLTRTESHLARFNNARAMFERLQEQGLRAKGGVSPATKKRSGSVSPSRSSPVRVSISPTRLSRSPSPGDSQSVGCSPKRDSPLSPKDKSRSADSILNEHYCQKSVMMPPICQSSHLNGRGHHLNLDLIESGAGEAIISPDPLTPELAAYLQESSPDDDLLTPNGNDILTEVRSKFLYSSARPSTLSSKPTDLSRISTTKSSAVTTSPKPSSARHTHSTSVSSISSSTPALADKVLGSIANRLGSSTSAAAQRPRIVSATPSTAIRTRLAEDRSKSHIPQLQKDAVGISSRRTTNRQPTISSTSRKLTKVLIMYW